MKSAALLLLTVITSLAILPPVLEDLPNFDRRPELATANLKEERRAAIATLRAAAPQVTIDVGGQSNVKWIRAERGFLTGPGGHGGGVSLATLATLATNETHRPTKAFVREHSGLFGFGAEALDRARVKREFTTPHNGLKTVVWEQDLDGISIFESVFISHTTGWGELVSVSSHFVPDPARAAGAGVGNRAVARQNPDISAAQAVARAAQNIGEELAAAGVSSIPGPAANAEQKQQFQAAPLAGPTEARLVWLPLTDETLRLCWEVVLTSRARGEMYRFLVDVENGEILVRHCLTEYISDASYRVFLSDSPSPLSPSCPTPCTTQPPVLAPVLVTLSALDTNASPNGWIDDGGNETRGNNVDAHTDRDDNDSPDLPRPQGVPFRTFDFPINLSLAPATYTNGAVTDLFYWCNWMHDQLYGLGFTEAAGNFQNNNFGRGGLGNDALQADAQDGGGFNNANMSTPPDGSAPRMQMYLFSGPTPDRDGDFDHEIVLHEYTHGLSNRRVGGGVGLNALQSRGMGEGWSDWYPMALLSEPGDDPHGVYASGAYATYLLSGLTTNYYFGIRRYPYSTDLTKNPLTFRDIDPTQASTHPGIPRSPLGGGTAEEVHNQGEVWCVTLWEARANLIGKYGHAAGNQLMLQLVTDGMNLTPANPNFLQARDGILQADVVNNGGANLPELWLAFAKRGMGFSATSPSSSTTVGVVEAYDVPDTLSIMPLVSLSVGGPVGGPFGPNPASFILTNTGSTNLSWSLLNTSTWISVTPSSGMLAPGGPAATVNVTLGAAANAFPLGNYATAIWFTNQTSGMVQARSYSLGVVGRSMSDDFDPGLDLTQWSGFGGVVGSTVRAASYGGFVSSPYSLWFGDSGSRFATTYPIDTTGGGTIGFAIRLADGTASTWERADSLPNEGVVLESSTNNGATWQLLGSYDTTSYYNWTTVTSAIPVVARSAATRFRWRQKSHSGSTYDHWAIDNVSIDATPATMLTFALPASVTEGDPLTEAMLTAAPAPTNDLVVTLNSSDATEVIVPATVTILAGQSNAAFHLTIVNDTELDGNQTAQVTATASGYAEAQSALLVQDDETATLALTVPSPVTEGDGTISGGLVTASAAPTADILVSLSSSDTSEIQVPASVWLPAGQTSAVFQVTVGNDTQIDGDQLGIVTAQVANWTDGLANIVVQDNEPTNLIVILPASAREGNGVLLGVGQVRIGGTLPGGLVVSLASSDSTELTVPASVTILAGQTIASFNLIVENDAAIDSSQTVTVTASAVGFSDGATNMVITDDESPPEPFSPSPAHLATNVWQTSDLAWQSGGVFGESITNEVYFGTVPEPGPTELLGATTGTAWGLPMLAPQTTYYWQIVARKTGVTPGPVWQFTTRGVDHFVWDAVSSPQYVGEPFSVTVTAKDAFETTVSNFTGTVSVSGLGDGGQTTNYVLGNVVHSSANTVDATIGYAFTPDTNLTVTHVRHYYGTKVSIWTDGGVLVATRNVVSIPGTWLQTPLNTPVILQAGVRYRLAAYTAPGGGPSHYRLDGIGSFPHGTINQGYSGSYDNFPTSIDGARWSLVDFVYTVGGLATLSISPTNSGPFSNGMWTANLTTLQLASNMVLRAEDGGGHTGVSNPFEVQLRNDIGVSIQDSPDPVSLGGDVTYTINVTNIGPMAADEVLVTNVLSPGVTLVSATPSQGSVQVFGNTVVGDLQTITGNDSATLTIVATTISVGTLTNVTTVSRSGADAYSANNSAVAHTTVQVPVITINDVSVFEGDSGTVNAVFTVSVSPAPGAPVMVDFATVSGSAVSPDDFIATNGILSFAIGETNRSFAVTVVGDPFYELDETYSVQLSAPVNATLADSFGLGTIRNNDAIPMLSIGDVVLAEGNEGTNTAIFPVTLSAASGLDVAFNYYTSDGNAGSGSDYAGRSGTLLIPAGSLSNAVAVAVYGDLAIEPDEVFYVELTAGGNVTLLQREGYGLIRNDDGLPGELDHFVWSAVAPVQYVGQPFPVTISALDAFDSPAVNFTNAAILTGWGSGGLVTNTILGGPLPDNSTSGTFTLGYSFTPTNDLTVTQVRSYFGTKVSIWTDGGVLLASQNVSGSAKWTTTPLASPLTLNAGSTYRVAAYTAGGVYYWRTDGSNTFPNGTIHRTYNSPGDAFPTSSDSAQWWAVDLGYLAGAANPHPIDPTMTGPFVDGLWSGNITALAPSTNFTVRASDGNGHSGTSGAMVVELWDDIGVSVTDSPDPVAVGAVLTYRIAVTNTGPAVATGVWVTNILPDGVVLNLVDPSQGTHATNGPAIVCELGDINAGSQAVITILVTPTATGVVSNHTSVARVEADSYLENNTATNTTMVIVPALSIADASGAEPAGTPTNLLFNVSLSVAGAQNITVDFATVNGSASAGSDYVATNGTLNFAPGQTNQTIAVQLLDDAMGEPNETFTVELSGAVNAVLGKASGVGTILDNDGPPEFQITALLATNSKVVDHNAQTSDDRGGIAISSTHVFVTGDSATARFAAGDLTGGVSLGFVRDSLCTDLRTETVYLLGNGSTPLTSSGGTVSTLIELNPTTGAPSGVVLPLSQSFSVASYGNIGIFSGYGRVMVFTGTSVYDIYIPTGTVTLRGTMARPNWYPSESWAIWGVAEYFGGALYLTYRSDSGSQIVRSRVPDGLVTTVATFSNLSDLASFVVSPSRNRWYFHYEGYGQFGGSSETLGYADAQLSFNSSAPPTITFQPAHQLVGLAGTAVFDVTAFGSPPLRYQWRKDGTNLVDGGNISGSTSNQLWVANVQTNDAGLYSVAITNAFGWAISSNAALTVDVPLPPSLPSNPSPADFATLVSVHTQLAWSGLTNVTAAGLEQAVNGVYGVIDTSGYDAQALSHLQGMPGLSGSSVSWATINGSSGSSLLAAFDVIYFAVDASATDYQSLRAAVTSGNALERYAYLGGTLVLNLAGNSSSQPNIGPGGLDYDRSITHQAATIMAPGHPFITGAGYGGTPLTAAMFNSWGSTDHGSLLEIPGGATELLRNTDGSSMIEYPWGAGRVIASTLTFGWNGSAPFVGPPFTNELQYAAFTAGVTPDRYAVYLGTNAAALTLIASNLTEPTFDPGALAFGTTYYWQVLAANPVGVVTGAVWQFTTAVDEVRFATATTSVLETAGLVTVIVTRANPAAGAFSVQYATTNGTAQAGADYAAVSGTLQFPTGVLSTNFQVPIFDDHAGEGAETIVLQLSQPTTNILLGEPANATLTIIDDDAVSALLIWDVINSNTLALSNALARAGIDVTMSTTSEINYTGNNPAPDGFRAVIHLNGTTYETAMPVAGQLALSNYVYHGGCFIHSEWNAYEHSFGHLRELTLFDRVSGSGGTIAVSADPLQTSHPVLMNVPSNFTFRASYNIGAVHPFATNPVTVLMRQSGTNDAVAVRKFGAGRVVGFHHAGNYDSAVYAALADTNVQQLFINGVFWTSDAPVGQPPVIANQPANQIVPVASPATFTVVVFGSAPFGYQWLKGNVAIFGATNASYTLNSVQYSNAGNYSVVVSNAFGFTNSTAAILTVVPYPTNISFYAFDTGWYDAGGSHDPSNRNYLCGDTFNTSEAPYRNWFAFNVPPLAGPVVAAQLRVNAYAFASPTGAETYQLRHVSTPVPTLVAGGTGLLSIYNDLADGVIYGSRSFSTNEMDQVVTMNLNSDFFANLVAAAGQPFALGGEIASLDVTSFNDEAIFWGSGGGATDVQLLITLGVSPAQLRLLPPEFGAGTLGLRVTTVDGSPITSERSANISIYASTNVALPLSNWTALAVTPVLTNGLLHLDGINPTSPPALYFRAVEGP